MTAAPSTSKSASAAAAASGGGDPRATPAMRQYRRFKEQHPDCILLFRMGDFYELFDNDAVVVSKAIGLTLTQRTAGVPMAGVPYHAIDSYLRRMIEHGFRVAVCDQIQDPKEAKGIVDRAVTRVITPGTLVDEHLLDESSANLVAAVQFLETGDDSAAVAAIAELSTGSFTLIDLPSGRVVDELARLNPTELVYVETADGSVPRRVERIREAIGCALTARPGWSFRPAEATDQLCRHYEVSTLAGFGLDEEDAAIGPAGALLRYLAETQPAGYTAVRAVNETPGSESPSTNLAHLRPPKRQQPDQHLTIDAASLRSLEIERTMRSGQAEGSLLSTIQRCRTPMGKRLLRTWLCFPLRDLDRINARQKSVAAFIADREFAERLSSQIGKVQDVARIGGRIAMNRATPRDLVALGRSVGRIEEVAALLEGIPAFAEHHDRLAALASSLAPLAASIAEKCVEDPPPHMREGNLFRDGIDGELDEARGLQRDANTWLAAYQKRLVEQTDIQSLKVGFNKVFGYYIEITHANTTKVPDAFSRKQTLKNAERYITPELKDFEDKVTTAEARAFERERMLFDRLCRQAAAHVGALSQYADLVAEIDVLLNFAEIAVRFDYVRPEMVDEPVLDIEQGRHPVLDRTLGERFVPNDCALATRRVPAAGDLMTPNVTRREDAAARCDDATLALITGPNMAGKSTYIRQVALTVLLAHTGSYVPAKRATIGATDRIFTRIGASDELHAGQSTFMVEMTETANILHHATEKSLVILDEIGRGTSTLDGLSLAWAIAESLASSRPRTLFATHYHELTSLADRLENVVNLHVSVREWGDEIIFLHRILPGRTDRSYGIHVAKIAGLPGAAIARAQELLESLTVHSEEVSREVPLHSDGSSGGAKPQAAKDSQLSLFTECVHHPVIDEIKQIDLNALTPMQAFDALRQIKDQLAK